MLFRYTWLVALIVLATFLLYHLSRLFIHTQEPPPEPDKPKKPRLPKPKTGKSCPDCRTDKCETHLKDIFRPAPSPGLQ
jgi:hypothetical protein